jgi:hypothetical protein
MLRGQEVSALPLIYVFNGSKHVTDDEAQAACAAIQRQLTEHFAPAWGMSAIMHFSPLGETVPDGVWRFHLSDQIDAPGALGYHTDDGTPSAIIDVDLCMSDGVDWSACLSHEVLEAVADPECTRCFDLGNGTALALEVCDAVEDSQHLDGSKYQIDGVTLENFNLPSYFCGGSGPWDFLGVLTAPARQRTPSGYDVSASLGQWTQTTGEKTRSAKRRARAGSRRAARGAA